MFLFPISSFSVSQHISFKLKFTELVQDIKPDVVAACAACEEVKKSSKFSKVFLRTNLGIFTLKSLPYVALTMFCIYLPTNGLLIYILPSTSCWR